MIAAEPYTRTTIRYFAAADAVDVPTTIYDARTAPELDWRSNGFELLAHHSRVTDW